MKQYFEEPVVEIISFKVDDVIATSPFGVEGIEEEDHLVEID